jgi:hypothetical protein
LPEPEEGAVRTADAEEYGDWAEEEERAGEEWERWGAMSMSSREGAAEVGAGRGAEVEAEGLPEVALAGRGGWEGREGEETEAEEEESWGLGNLKSSSLSSAVRVCTRLVVATVAVFHIERALEESIDQPATSGSVAKPWGGKEGVEGYRCWDRHPEKRQRERGQLRKSWRRRPREWTTWRTSVLLQSKSNRQRRGEGLTCSPILASWTVW